LGGLHGLTELLPISSSGHTTIVPWLVGSSYAERDPELRKALEVALHTGALAALLTAHRRELGEQLRHLDHRHLAVIALATGPAALAGWQLERRIETEFGTPRTIAAGLLAGALAMAVADRCPEERRAGEAGPVDALWLGLAEASALVPGISRGGATLAAARWLRFTRRQAEVLSRQLAYPVIAGAAGLKLWRLRRRRWPRNSAIELGAAALTACASTSLTLRLLDDTPVARRLLPYSLYRIALAMIILRRLHREPAARADDQGHPRPT
jgi:undecaprenyl-diphosphatase